MASWRRVVVILIVVGTIAVGRYAGWGGAAQGPTTFDVVTFLAVVLAVAWFGWTARLATGGAAPSTDELRTRLRGALFIRTLGDVAMAPALIWAAYGFVTSGVLVPMPLWVILLFVAGVIAALGAEAVSWSQAKS